MEDNQAYVICVKSDKNTYYLGQRELIMTRIRNAVFYNDELHVKFELSEIITKYAHTQAYLLNDSKNLFIKKVEINIL